MRKIYFWLPVALLAAVLGFALLSGAAGNMFFPVKKTDVAGDQRPAGQVKAIKDRSGNSDGQGQNMNSIHKEQTINSSIPEQPAGNMDNSAFSHHSAIPAAHAGELDTSPPSVQNGGSDAGPTGPGNSGGDTSLTGPAARVIWSLPVKERVVFITIDDGWYPDWSVLKMMRQYHLPVTAFLIEAAAQKHLDYWRAFLAAGGDIEDHTFSHPKLTGLSPAAMAEQIDRPVDYYRALGARPVLLRPPYGDYNRTVCQAAYAGGIEDVVMWNAVMANGSLQTYNGRPLQPGDIILLHWVPGLDEQLTKLLTILKRQQLGVADLRTALTGPGSLKVASLDKFVP